jgi:hypothetical protein
LNDEYGRQVRANGFAGGMNPWRRFEGLGVGLYHVDTQEGLKALADAIKLVVAFNHSFLCGFCQEADVGKVKADEPYSNEHWACPACDSTYFMEHYPREVMGDRVTLAIRKNAYHELIPDLDTLATDFETTRELAKTSPLSAYKVVSLVKCHLQVVEEEEVEASTECAQEKCDETLDI